MDRERRDRSSKDFAAREKDLPIRDALKEPCPGRHCPARCVSRRFIGQRGDRRDEAIDTAPVRFPNPARGRSRARAGRFTLKNTQAAGAFRASQIFVWISWPRVTNQDRAGCGDARRRSTRDFRQLGARVPQTIHSSCAIKAKIQIAKNQVTDAIATLAQAACRNFDVRNPMRL